MNKGIVPLVITYLLILISIVMVLFADYSLETTHYIGILGLILSSIFYFTQKNIYLIVFGLALIAGLLGFLDLFYINVTSGFGMLKFNPIFLILIILLFVFNKDIMDKAFPEKL